MRKEGEAPLDPIGDDQIAVQSALVIDVAIPVDAETPPE